MGVDTVDKLLAGIRASVFCRLLQHQLDCSMCQRLDWPPFAIRIDFDWNMSHTPQLEKVGGDTVVLLLILGDRGDKLLWVQSRVVLKRYRCVGLQRILLNANSRAMHDARWRVMITARADVQNDTQRLVGL
jgi:hypothetical protein